MIKEKAQEFAINPSVDNFSTSNGWLKGFIERYCFQKYLWREQCCRQHL